MRRASLSGPGSSARRALRILRHSRCAGIPKATLADRHAAVARYVLNATAPDAVRIHFETAKNLFLYGWFVYRFHPVASDRRCRWLEFHS